MSEIDDIFASKGNAKIASAHSHGTSSSSLSSSSKKEKRKQWIRKPAAVPSDYQQKVSPSKKRRLPETVIDTSDNLCSLPKRHKTLVGKKSMANKGDNTKSTDSLEDAATFKDSRGTGSRKSSTAFHVIMLIEFFIGKRTEEGWLIYNENELGLATEGGGKLSKTSAFLLSEMISNQTHHSVPLIAIVVSLLVPIPFVFVDYARLLNHLTPTIHHGLYNMRLFRSLSRHII